MKRLPKSEFIQFSDDELELIVDFQSSETFLILKKYFNSKSTLSVKKYLSNISAQIAESVRQGFSPEIATALAQQDLQSRLNEQEDFLKFFEKAKSELKNRDPK